jgi:hypothetical protein
VSVLVNRGHVHDSVCTICDGISSTHEKIKRIEMPRQRGDIRIKDIKVGFRKDDLVPRESLLEHNQK